MSTDLFEWILLLYFEEDLPVALLVVLALAAAAEPSAGHSSLVALAVLLLTVGLPAVAALGVLLLIRLLDSGWGYWLKRALPINDYLRLEGKGIPEQDLLPSTRPLMVVAVVVGAPGALAGWPAHTPVGKALTVELETLRFFARASEELYPLLILRLMRFNEDRPLSFPSLPDLQVLR